MAFNLKEIIDRIRRNEKRTVENAKNNPKTPERNIREEYRELKKEIGKKIIYLKNEKQKNLSLLIFHGIRLYLIDEESRLQELFKQKPNLKEKISENLYHLYEKTLRLLNRLEIALNTKNKNREKSLEIFLTSLARQDPEIFVRAIALNKEEYRSAIPTAVLIIKSFLFENKKLLRGFYSNPEQARFYLRDYEDLRIVKRLLTILESFDEESSGKLLKIARSANGKIFDAEDFYRLWKAFFNIANKLAALKDTDDEEMLTALRTAKTAEDFIAELERIDQDTGIDLM